MDNRNPMQHVWAHGIRIIKYVLFAVLMLLVIGVLAIETMRYFKIKNIPEDVTISAVQDTRIDGKLELLTDRHSSSYWLFQNKNGNKKLIMYVGGIRGQVIVNVINQNLIEITYDYLDEPSHEPREDKKYTINLAKNETQNVSWLYKLLTKYLNYSKIAHSVDVKIKLYTITSLLELIL